MSNTLVTVDMVAREAQRIAHESSQFIATVDRQYDDSFAKTGAKIGSTLRVKKPNQYVRTTGTRVMTVQEQSEATQTITVATQDHVDMSFSSAELALTIDELSKLYIEPAVKGLISGIEGDFLAYATKATYNCAGTAGTAITSLDVPGKARALLNKGLAPKDSRAIQLDSVTMGALVNGMAGYFNPSKDGTDRFREGMIARTAMADYYENERIWTMTNGSDVGGTTDAAAGVTDGGTVLSADTASPVTYTVGQVFTIAGVYACHPETKASYGVLQQFTNTAGTGSGGDMTISPPTYLTGAKKNVCKSDGTDLATTDFNSQTMTCVGAVNASYALGLMYHPEAFQFVTADLPLMGGADKCARRVQDGLSLRVWQDGDIRNDELLMRIDILYGMAALRPAWACRLVGSAAA